MKNAYAIRTEPLQARSNQLSSNINNKKIVLKNHNNEDLISLLFPYCQIIEIALILIIPFLLLFSSCKSEHEIINPLDLIPPITTSGANTMGCLIDGEPFIAGRDKDVWDNGIWLDYSHLDDSIFTLFGKDSRIQSKINLETIYHKGEQKLSLTYPNGPGAASNTILTAINKTQTERFFVSQNRIGNLTILKDDDFAISGTFEFDAVGAYSHDTIHITNGRFDVHK